MLRFVIRRLLQMAGVLLVLSLLVFVWLRSLPGGPVSALLGERQTEARREALEEALGLDQPLPVQYLRFMQRAFQGDFGVSTQVLPGEDALDIFLSHAHLDHVTGVAAAKQALGVPVGLHRDDNFLYERVVQQGQMFGLVVAPQPPVKWQAHGVRHQRGGGPALEPPVPERRAPIAARRVTLSTHALPIPARVRRR